jgi:hypothetical protein
MNKKEHRDKWKKENPIYMKLYKLLYRHCYKFRKRTGIHHGIKITDMLGCSIKEFQNHLEQQFSNDMTWDNYGKMWEVDHIIPLSSDKTKEGFIKLNHYTNLQPLLSYDNRIKGDKII